MPPVETDTGFYESCLRELRNALAYGRLSGLTLIFADGVRAVVRPIHRYRFWRPVSRILESNTQ